MSSLIAEATYRPTTTLTGGRIVIGVDVGGTCTDCVMFLAGGRIQIGKALSTPPDFGQGVLDAVRGAARAAGMSLTELLSEADLFLHGSTVVDNVILTREGARVGLITTAGFEDTLLVTRGAYGRWSGLTEDRIKHPVDTDRPPPLVAPDCIRGIRERVDWKGSVVEALDVCQAGEAVRELVETAKVDAIAVSLLWSFRNPAHECLVRDIVHERYPGVHVSLSCEVAPVPGEYERTSTTAINAYAGEVTRAYLDNLSTRLAGAGFQGSVLVMQGYGGLVDAADAARRPVTMLECGPVAGVVGSQQLGRSLGHANIIAADMGGTTFKVGIVQDGHLDYAREPIVDRYHYSVPKIEIASIGAGGGSIVWIDPLDSAPKIGPKSAGARPGPILSTWWEFIISGELFGELLPSLWRMFAGYFIGVALGVEVGLLMGYVPFFYNLLEPITEVLRPIPSPAYLPIVILFLGIDDEMKIFMIAFASIFPVLLNTYSGVRSIDPIQLQTARTFGVSGRKLLTQIVLPASSPYIFTGMRVSLAVALIVMVISEMVAASSGIGYFILSAQRGFKIREMFAGVLTLAMLGYILNRLFLFIENRVLAWHYGYTQQRS